jgi:hypothetical protein
MLSLILASSLALAPQAFQQHCFDCHGDGASKGGLALDEVLVDRSVDDADAWLALRARLRSHDMPPDEWDRPSNDEYDAMLSWVDDRIRQLADEAASPGRVGPRRLNNVEYARTIEDLFGVELDVLDRFPADGVGEGFDTTAAVLSLPPLLLEKYFDAAEDVARRAIHDPAHPGWEEIRFEADQLETRGRVTHRSGVRWMTSRGAVGSTWSLPRDGAYLVRVGAFGQQAGDEPVKLELRIDGVRNDVIEVTEVRSAPGAFERRVHLPGGEVEIEVVFVNDFYQPKHPDPGQRDRNAGVLWLSVTGPIDEVRPTPFQASLPEAFPDESRQRHLERILHVVLPKTWRRPVTEEEVLRLAELAEAGAGPDSTIEDRLRICLTAMLVSPSFLLRTEEEPIGPDPRFLHGHEIAVRMASFLWSSTPDDELLRAASTGALADPGLRRRQVRRMLEDPRSTALAEHFATQWLQIRSLPERTPDPGRFPDVDAALLTSMQRETVLFIDDIIRSDGTAWDILQGDFTYLDEPLAAHYGIEWSGPEGVMRRVSLGEDRPSGIFGHASVLTATSNPTRTAPVKRGKWILEALLDDPPPPPPPGIDALPEAEGAREHLGLRELMALHTSDPTCRSCHARMDPLGLAMESLDAVGRMRASSDIEVLDLEATLPDGRRFTGVDGLQEVLVGDAAFLRSMARHMLVYALGRPVGFNDEAMLLGLTEVLQEDPRVQRLIFEIIDSDAFLRRSPPGGSS